MPAVARVTVELSDAAVQQELAKTEQSFKRMADTGTQSAQRLNGAQRILENQSRRNAAATRQAEDASLRLSKAQTEAATKAVLLGQRFGVTLPTAMQRMIVRSKAAEAAVNTLFKIGVAGFAISAVGLLISQIDQLTESLKNGALALGGYTKAMRDLEQAAVAASTAGLLGFSDVKTGELLLRVTNAQISAKQKELDLVQHRIKATAFSISQALEQDRLIEREKKIRGDLAVLESQRAEQLKALAPLRKKQHDDEIARLRKEEEQLKKNEEAWRKANRESLARVAGVPTIEGLPPFAGITSSTEAQQKLLEVQEQNLDVLISTLPAEQRILAELQRKQAVLDVIKNQYQLFPGVVQAATDQEEFLQRKAAQEIAQIRQQQFETMAQSIEGFIQRVFLTARSFRDVWRQLVFQMVGTWVSGISKMIAAWVLGHRQMAAVSAGAPVTGGGFLGALGSILLGGGGGGFGIGVGPGGTAPTFPGGITSGFSSGGFDLSGLPLAPSFGFGAPLSAGGGARVGTALPGGAIAGTARGGVGGLLAGLPLALLLGAGAVGFRSPARGAIAGGLAAGGLLSIAAAAAPSLLGSSIGFLFGPIGIGIGALVGALFGFLSKGRRRRQRERYEREQFAPAVKAIEDAYSFHQLDYLSARNQLEQLRTQGLEQVRALGGKGTVINQLVNAAIQRINAIEQERQRRMGITPSPPIFEKGGLIGPSGHRTIGPWGIPAAGPGGGFRPELPNVAPRFQGGGAVGIVAHEGEFVVSARAASRIGRSRLDYMNATGRTPGGGDGLTIQIVAWDGPSVDAWLRNGGAEKIRRGMRKMMREGA